MSITGFGPQAVQSGRILVVDFLCGTMADETLKMMVSHRRFLGHRQCFVPI